MPVKALPSNVFAVPSACNVIHSIGGGYVPSIYLFEWKAYRMNIIVAKKWTGYPKSYLLISN